MIRKIALEEHFMAPGFEDYWKPTTEDLTPEKHDRALSRLVDFGDLRLETMEKAGIERSVLSLAGPGVQAERDTAIACRKAREVNDFLARQVQKRPDRYSGFAHIAMQDAKAAADELERCLRELKFCGAMINGHTNGQYLDHPSIDPFWERAQALGALIYLHPADPVAPLPVLAGHRVLRRATWEWTIETGSHALRIVFGGVFDRFPRLKLALGHLGETLPFLLWRLDSRSLKLYSVKMPKLPSEYIRDNIVVTTSGMFSTEPVMCSIAALGRQNVMFSADYPFESTEEAAASIDELPIDEDLRADICFNNARRLLRL